MANVRRQKLYEKLKGQFRVLRATLNPHLDVTTLADNGIDATLVDLHQETRDGGAYFLPMTQNRLDSIGQLAPFRNLFQLEDGPWQYSDAIASASEFQELLHSRKDKTFFPAIKASNWRDKTESSPLENSLYEYQCSYGYSDPTCQHEWELSSVYETQSLPHETCIAIHDIPNVHGPLRSELMIVIALMANRMKRRRFKEVEIFPIMLLSIIGRNARIIQAHTSPSEQRVKVRYSQLFDFAFDTAIKKDLFLRWLLSDPTTETELFPEKTPQSINPAGDAAPPLTAVKATSSPSTNAMRARPKTLQRRR